MKYTANQLVGRKVMAGGMGPFLIAKAIGDDKVELEYVGEALEGNVSVDEDKVREVAMINRCLEHGTWVFADEDVKAQQIAFLDSYGKVWDMAQAADNSPMMDELSVLLTFWQRQQGLPHECADDQHARLLFGDMEVRVVDAPESKRRVYAYIVDCDERGEFRAHIEDEDGDVMTTFFDAQMVEDGYMKHMRDVVGLKAWAVERELMSEEDEMIDEKEAIRRGIH